jgi:hypothetical protein
MFAGDTVVEHLFFVGGNGRLALEYQPDALGTEIAPTTEDGQPVTWAADYFDGEVTLHAAHPWAPTAGNHILLIPAGAAPTTDGGERIGWERAVLLADPGTVEEGCWNGPPAADAEALAENIRSYPGFETTAPKALGREGAEGLMMDVVITEGAQACHAEVTSGLRPGDRMRLYLFDAPEGSSMRVLAVPLVVPESDFERAVEATAPIAVEFHTP